MKILQFGKILLLSCFCIFFTNCEAQKKKSSTKNQAYSAQKVSQKAIYFDEGENRFLSDYQMNVTFNKLVEDSRCPKGTNCIWQGVAKANITLMGTATRPASFDLSTMDSAQKNLQKSVFFNGYKITLAEVTPYPTGNGKSTGKSRIGLIFEKSDGVSATSKVVSAER